MDQRPPRRTRRDSKKRPPQYNLDKLNTPPARRPSRPVTFRKRKEEPAPLPPKDTRLNRFIANAGICSRREADTHITAGHVQINGVVVTELGRRVKPDDQVRYKGRIISAERPVYILLNKPKDFITTTKDPQGRPTVMDLVKDAAPQRLYPVGRLDRQTTGLLLLTNDGDLSKKLTHPSYQVPKVYRIELDKPIEADHFDQLSQGITLEDGFIKPDDLAVVSPDGLVLGIEIHSGKNRIVRRMFEHFGYQIEKLDRTIYAGLTKAGLGRGKWRFLKEQEVVRLKFFKASHPKQR
ncbi:MAG: pseudouridine synthase [Bernardetiaceae bacterium]